MFNIVKWYNKSISDHYGSVNGSEEYQFKLGMLHCNSLSASCEKMYEKARRGESIELSPRRISIFQFDIERSLDDRVTCFKGTYIRSLSADVGKALGADEVLKGSKSGLLPSKVTVEMSNNLTLMQLDLHCKDKHNDLGPQTLNDGDTYSFRFRPNAFADVTLYFCRFAWIGTVYHFDIYDQERDKLSCDDNCCSWQIFEEGPCKIKERSRECFKWNE
ncbi:tRNA pseudouridine synthase B [Spatholobus suberectus]|nr:tRNA pseudouridine synthase B [Spatholobus suberectus]